MWTVSAGNAAQGVAFAARQAGAPCSVMVMDTAPETKLRAIERLGATHRARHLRRMLADGRAARLRPHDGHFVHPFDDDRFIAGNGTAGLEILEDLPDVDAIVAPLGGGGLLAGIGAAVRALKPGRRGCSRPNRKPPRRWPPRCAAARPGYFDGWTASFVDGAGGKSVLPTMWPLLQTLVDGSIVVSLDEAARR